MKKNIIASAIAASVFSVSVFAAPTEITVASFPNFNQVAEIAVPMFEKKYPDIKVKVVTLAYADHHNAMI